MVGLAHQKGREGQASLQASTFNRNSEVGPGNQEEKGKSHLPVKTAYYKLNQKLLWWGAFSFFQLFHTVETIKHTSGWTHNTDAKWGLSFPLQQPWSWPYARKSLSPPISSSKPPQPTGSGCLCRCSAHPAAPFGAAPSPDPALPQSPRRSLPGGPVRPPSSGHRHAWQSRPAGGAAPTRARHLGLSCSRPRPSPARFPRRRFPPARPHVATVSRQAVAGRHWPPHPKWRRQLPAAAAASHNRAGGRHRGRKVSARPLSAPPYRRRRRRGRGARGPRGTDRNTGPDPSHWRGNRCTVTRCLVTAQTDSPESQPAHDAPHSSPRSPMGTRSATGGGGPCSDSGREPMRGERVEPADPLANRGAVRRRSRAWAGAARAAGRKAAGGLSSQSIVGRGAASRSPGREGSRGRPERRIRGCGCQCWGVQPAEGSSASPPCFASTSQLVLQPLAAPPLKPSGRWSPASILFPPEHRPVSQLCCFPWVSRRMELSKAQSAAGTAVTRGAHDASPFSAVVLLK